MREIKFRAWTHGSMMFFDTPDKLEWFSCDNGRSGPVRTLTECGLMQYTGLKDKKGLGMNAGWYLQRNDFESWVELESMSKENGYNHEIIGNIYENPESINQSTKEN